MTTGRLRDTFSLLLRENRSHTSALSADAERAIRRRVGLRWAGRVGALIVVGSLGTAAAAGAHGGGTGVDGATESPTPNPTIGIAAASFPVTGGPEFVSAAAGLKCGDPAPKPNPMEHDVELTLTDMTSDDPGNAANFYGDIPTVEAQLSQTPGTDLGVVSNSDMPMIFERDGVIVGIAQYGGVGLGWNAPTAAPDGQGQYGTPLIANWIGCPGFDRTDSTGLEPGTYDVVAMTRVFSTPESVALQQVFFPYSNVQSLDPGSLDPNGIYLPGSYDCAQTIAWQSPARACLPDYTDDAAYDPETSTVTVLYDPTDLVEEFSVVLVSELLTVTVIGEESLPWWSTKDDGSLGPFDSIDDFTCGASASYNALAQGPNGDAWALLDAASVGPGIDGGPFGVLVLATVAPDGSRVELLPGARLVYLQNSMVQDPESNSSTSIDTVTGTSAVSADEPFTTDRYAGPRPVTLTSEPPTACPGVDAATVTRTAQPVLVGTWRIETPDGTVTTVDFASDLSNYYG